MAKKKEFDLKKDFKKEKIVAWAITAVMILVVGLIYLASR